MSKSGNKIELTPEEFAKWIEKQQSELNARRPVVKTTTCRVCGNQLWKGNRARVFVAIRKIERALEKKHLTKTDGIYYCKAENCGYGNSSVGGALKHLLIMHEIGEWYYPQFCKFDFNKMSSRDASIIERGVDGVSPNLLIVGPQLPPSGNINSEGIQKAKEREINAKRRDMRIATNEDFEMVKKEWDKLHKDVKVTKLNKEEK